MKTLKIIFLFLFILFVSCGTLPCVMVDTPDCIAIEYGTVPTSGYHGKENYKGCRYYYIIDSEGNMHNIGIKNHKIVYDRIMVKNY